MTILVDSSTEFDVTRVLNGAELHAANKQPHTAHVNNRILVHRLLSFVGELEKILINRTNDRIKPMKTILLQGTETVIALHQEKKTLMQETKGCVKPMKTFTDLGIEFDVLRT